jgi:16S rRNA U516 pseudouridylate synthase RsuA-like enzyme
MKMSRTKKIQVTLEEAQYHELTRIARRDGKKLAGLVRESIEKYCLTPEAERAKRKALQKLLSFEPSPVPEVYGDWKHLYGGLKTSIEKDKT